MPTDSETKEEIRRVYIDYLKTNMLSCLDKRDSMAIEASIKQCEIAMTLDIGVMGGLGILSILKPMESIFLLIILGIILLTSSLLALLAFNLRRDIIEVNRKAYDDRSSLAEEMIETISQIDMEHLSVQTYVQKFDCIKEDEVTKLAKINDEIKTREKKLFPMLKSLNIGTSTILVVVSLMILFNISGGVITKLLNEPPTFFLTLQDFFVYLFHLIVKFFGC